MTFCCREQQAALVGAIQGLERQLTPLFAQWNHAALTSFAERLAVSIDRALVQQAQLQRAPTPAAAVAPSSGLCSLPAPLPSPASVNLIRGPGSSLHAPVSKLVGPLQLSRPAETTLADTTALGTEQHAAVQQLSNMEHQARSGPQPAVLPLRASAAGEAAPAAGAGVLHNWSVQPSQTPPLAGPGTPSALEAQRPVASSATGIVMGIPYSVPSPLSKQPQAPVSWPSPAAALGFLQQLFRGAAPSLPPGSHLNQATAIDKNTLAGPTTDCDPTASSGGQAGHSIAVSQRHAGGSPQAPLATQPLPTMESLGSIPGIAVRSEAFSASPLAEEASNGYMPCCGPSTPGKAPQSPSCGHESGQAAQHSASPPTMAGMSALPAPQTAMPTATSGSPVLLTPSPPSTPTGFPQPMSRWDLCSCTCFCARKFHFGAYV